MAFPLRHDDDAPTPPSEPPAQLSCLDNPFTKIIAGRVFASNTMSSNTEIASSFIEGAPPGEVSRSLHRFLTSPLFPSLKTSAKHRLISSYIQLREVVAGNY